MLHNSQFCILKRDSFPRPCCQCCCSSFEEQLNCPLSLRNCWTVEHLRNSCRKLWPGLPSASITNVTSTPLLTLGGFSYERFPQVLTTLKDLGWAQFDLPAHKKICFQVQVCKHPEGELVLKSKEATPFPEYLKFLSPAPAPWGVSARPGFPSLEVQREPGLVPPVSTFLLYKEIQSSLPLTLPSGVNDSMKKRTLNFQHL